MWRELSDRGSPAVRPARERRPAAPAGARLQRLEEALLDDLFDAHPNRDRALGRMLGDIAAAEAPAPAESPTAARRRALVVAPRFGPGTLRRIETQLVAAVLTSHPGHEAALDRLLDAVVGQVVQQIDRIILSTPAAERVREQTIEQRERERAEYDMLCDNDFDGLG